MINNPSLRRRLKITGYTFVGFLVVSVFAMSLLEVWVMFNTDHINAYGAILPESTGLPNSDQRGAFLLLNDTHSPQFPSNWLQLLATSEPGVVDTTEGAHLLPSDLKYVYVQSEVIGEPSEYRVYRIGVDTPDQMKVNRITGGRSLTVEPQNGVWQPGAYLVDIPTEGMFGGRQYFQFFIDPQK